VGSRRLTKGDVGIVQSIYRRTMGQTVKELRFNSRLRAQYSSLFQDVQPGSGDQPGSYTMGTADCFPLVSSRGVHLILHLYLVLRLRIHGGIPQIHTQGAPEGKVTILGGYIIGHSKQKSVSVHASYSERFPK
jgi:hypothetical protein